MSVSRDYSRPQSISISQPQQQIRFSSSEDSLDSPIRRGSFPNILPELTKIVRKLLPHEIPLNIHVRNVEYIEHGCNRLSGTLYMTIFRLVFAPDNEIENNKLISSGNKYIGEYDIPLTSIYKINVTPVDTRSGFRSFLSENQMPSETKTFTIITRDFRSITFSKPSIRKSTSTVSKPEISSTKIETYIDALKVYCRFQDKKQLYPFLATRKPSSNTPTPTTPDDHSVSLMFSAGRSPDDEFADFCSSNDERIKSYLMYQDWHDDLQEANENRWIVDQNKFEINCIVRDEGPFVRLTTISSDDNFKDWIWHWTHTSEIEVDRYKKYKQHMLVTVPAIVDITLTAESSRRTTIEPTLTYTRQTVYEQEFQRYNLGKFPFTLKRLETSFEKLVEICATNPEEDDDKWLTKLNTCRWLRYVSNALHGAASLAKLLNYTSIQLVGSDIDNSCLMSSLIQILLRPKCRTIKGFCELIVREWIIRGHPFRERFGQVMSDSEKNPAQESPIFLLFLDCVHQLINQNPLLFEFTDYFLIETYHSVCYCYHHTFAFNSVIERLNAINNCPKNILILSSFDFSLYLYRDVYRLLKNHTSIFTLQKMPPSPPPPLPPRRSKTNKRSPIQEVITQSLNSSRTLNRPSFRQETPTNDTLSTTSIELSPSSPEQFEYDAIETPQKFPSDLYVDWRVFNLVLWSKCYCRYDQNYMPSFDEQQLSSEVYSLQEQFENSRIKTEQQTPSDVCHSFNYANSWHPQVLVTHV